MKQIKLVIGATLFSLIASTAISDLITDRVKLDRVNNVHGLTDKPKELIFGSQNSTTLNREMTTYSRFSLVVFQAEESDQKPTDANLGGSFLYDIEANVAAALSNDVLLKATIPVIGDLELDNFEELAPPSVAEVPEPTTISLLMIGLLSLVFARRRSQH